MDNASLIMHRQRDANEQNPDETNRQMSTKPPIQPQHGPPRDPVINIGVGILLTIVTCGIYGLYWQYRQMEALNGFLGRKEYDFWMWFLLSIVTCGA